MKKILLGLFILSAVSMASEIEEKTNGDDMNGKAEKSSTVAKGTFTNRFGISYGLKGSESIDDEKVLDTKGNNLYNDSLSIDYKLLYNLTNKFRWGAEFGITNTTMSSESKELLEKKGYELKQDSMITLMIGPTLEYDLYSGDYISFYLNGSGGLSLGMQDATYKKTYNENGVKETKEFDNVLVQAFYTKVGLGIRLNNGLGLEVGEKGEASGYFGFVDTGDIHKDGYESTYMTKWSTYFELNYSF